jgi:predicted RecA/RadA family phage recombinase
MARLTDAFVQPGESINLTAPYDRTAGQGALVGAIFGVATAAVLSGSAMDFIIEGVFKIDKTAGQVFAQGALVYWDNAAKSVTSVTAGNTRIGVATVAAIAGDAQATVRLNGAGAPTGA